MQAQDVEVGSRRIQDGDCRLIKVMVGFEKVVTMTADK